MEDPKNLTNADLDPVVPATDEKSEPQFIKKLSNDVKLPEDASSPLKIDPIQAAEQGLDSEGTDSEHEVIPTGYERPVRAAGETAHKLKKDESDENSIEDQTSTHHKEPIPTPEPCDTAHSPYEKATTTPQDIAKMSLSEIVDTIALLVQQDKIASPQEIKKLREAFEKKKSEQTPSTEENPETASLQSSDIQEQRLKDLLAAYESNLKAYKEAQKEKQKAALETKQHLLQSLESLIKSNDDFGTISKRFREIEKDWHNTGDVPEESAKEIQEAYSKLREDFYDLKQLNNEFREYDFKKNLEAKESLIQQATDLLESENAFSVSRQLNELHERWKEIGPVSKEIREDLWKRFSDLSKEIRDKQTEFIASRKEEEAKNLDAKKKICEEVEDVRYETLDTIKKWNDIKDRIISLQATWKEIGYVAKSEKTPIEKRFRAACDVFFAKKSSFFKDLFQEQDENYKKKMLIVEEAESLAHSTEWSKTTNRLIELQKEWKKIGHVHPRHRNIFQRFRTACNTFFDNRKEAQGDQKKENARILSVKKELLTKAKELLDSEETDVKEKIQPLVQEFKDAGNFYGRKNRDVNDQFYDTINEIYVKWKIDRHSKNLESYSERMSQLRESGEEEKLRNEILYLTRKKEKEEQELMNYEQSTQMMTSSSKWGNNMLKDIEQKINHLRKEIEIIAEKVSVAKTQLAELRKQNKQKKES